MLADYPDLRVSVQGINALRGGGTRQSELEFNLLGPDLEKLDRLLRPLIAERMRRRPGFVDVDTTLSVRKPELRVAIDRERASDLGLRVEEIAATLQPARRRRAGLEVQGRATSSTTSGCAPSPAKRDDPRRRLRR